MPYIGNITQDFNVNNAMLDTDSVTSIKIVDGTIEGADIAANLDLSDSQKIRFGAGNDLQIYHDGSNSYINDGGTGALRYLSNTHYFANAALSEIQAQFISNGAVELYYDNDRKLRTVSSGCQVESATGDAFLVVRSEEDDAGADAFIRLQVENTSATSGVLFGDSADGDIGQILYEHADNSMRFTTNTAEQWRITSAGHLENNNDTGRIKLGASDDLQLYHDGTASFIKNTTGGLNLEDTGGYFRVKSDDIKLEAANGEDFLECDANGAVSLYYDASKKFETLSGGAKVTGELRVTTDLVMNSADSQTIYLGAGNDLQIHHNGTHSFIKDSGTGNLMIATSAFQVTNAAVNETMIYALPDGGVKLYYDNSEKLETRPTGLRMQNTSVFDVNGGQIQFGHSSSTDDRLRFGTNGDDLQIFHGGNGQFDCNTGNMELRHTGSFSSARSIFLRARVDESSVTAISDGAVELYYDNTIRFETQSDGARTTGLDKVRSADLNVTHVTRPLYLSIATNTTKTITLTGLIGSAKFTAGGYANAGQGALALHILFGGAMFATQHYNVNVLQNSAMQNTSTSLTKNGTSYVIAISNSSNTYSLNLSMCLEYIGATVGYAVA